MATDNGRFSPGQNIALREVFKGKIWCGRPEIVVQDTPELIALFLMPGAPWKRPRTVSGGRVPPLAQVRGEYVLKDDVWQDYCLRLSIPGKDYSVLLFRDIDMNVRSWYINMEKPLRRFPLGFDYLDEVLDIIIKPDLSEWHWKDEDELEEAIDCGMVTRKRASFLYEEGQKAAEWIISGGSPFNKWIDWRPDPSWTPPVLPQGWDRV